MDAQSKPVEASSYAHDPHDVEKGHHNHHLDSTAHLFNPDEHKQERKLTPYSLYLMNNNWHADVRGDDPQVQWTWPDYACGIFAGVLLFIGLGATELVNMYLGKTAVAIYLITFIIIFFVFVTSLFSFRK